MKAILIRPNNTERGADQPSYVPPGGDESFDMLSYLTNEFDNADIRALIVELDESPMSVATSQIQLEFLKQAARNVVACWEGGDLAAAVRALDRHSRE